MKEKQTKKKVQTKVTQPITYIHIDEFLLTAQDISEGVKAGFRVHMKGRTYQDSHETFRKELENYLNPKKSNTNERGEE